ncbi:trypsin-like serine protease [Brevibacterium sp. 5221]|uniref:Trypsin-like serine protease n=1 Tax=Brevibacterium rongguiense TaxID=2695267 RepID=A0A6N9HA51_9MICO|nr:trypsin-like serine protease [Brevibacterium rongguiense]MYM20392.1 trypsin-like serine protease [Brevibacterium rongguiense]
MSATRAQRFTSLGAAAVLGFGGVALAAPAASAAPSEAPKSDQKPQAKPSQATASFAEVKAEAEATFKQDPTIQGFGQAQNGKPVVVKLKGKGVSAASAGLIKDNKIQTIELKAPLTARAGSPGTTVGGGGYAAGTSASATSVRGYCSIGFASLSSSDFSPQAVSAGHCTGVAPNAKADITTGKAMSVFETLASGDGAYTGKPTDTSTARLAPKGFTGKVVDYRFGKPGQTKAARNGEEKKTSTDFSLIALAKGTPVVPRITQWDEAGAKKNDLLTKTRNVTGIATAKNGEKIARSGRTTGYKTGKVIMTSGWVDVSGRKVYGFGTDALSDHGDSGGPFVNSRGNALGVLSGGGEQSNGTPFSFAADLSNDLNQMKNKTRVLVAKTIGYKTPSGKLPASPKPTTAAPTTAAPTATDSASATPSSSAPATQTPAPKPAAPEGSIKPGGKVSGTGATGFTGGTFVDSKGKKHKVEVKGDKWSFTAEKTEGTVTGKVYLTTKYTVTRGTTVKYITSKLAEDPKPEPSTPAPTKSPSKSPSKKPTSTAPAPAQAKLAVQPRTIGLDKFVGNGDKDKKVGVTIALTGAKPGSKATITTSKDGISAKKETATVAKDGTVSTRVWGLASASDKKVYLGKYDVKANFESNATKAKSTTAQGATALNSSFKVVADDQGNGGSNDDGNKGNGDLPRTGSEVGVALAAAAGLLALGAGLVLTVRRRTRR